LYFSTKGTMLGRVEQFFFLAMVSHPFRTISITIPPFLLNCKQNPHIPIRNGKNNT